MENKRKRLTGPKTCSGVTMTTVFEKIINGTIPCNKIYEDDSFIAFHDIAPQAPVHVLIVPKKHLPGLSDAKAEDALLLGKGLLIAAQLAKKLHIESGYRLIINTGKNAGQTVFHLHFHLLGGHSLDEQLC